MKLLSKIFAQKTMILVVLELLVCIGLGILLWNVNQKSLAKDQDLATFQNQAQESQNKLKELEKQTTFIASQYETLRKTTVPATDYSKLVIEIQSIKNSAVEKGIIPADAPLARPEQILAAVKQALSTPRATASVSAGSEIDFLVRLVEKEIGKGVVDTKDTEKNAACLYHMQKVLDTVGYGLNETITTTNQAVLKFQTDNQLKADGKVGAKTWAKISELWTAAKPKG